MNASAGAIAPQRLPLLDLLKVIAAQLIVLHHLAFYGPMSDVVAEATPQLMQLMSWLSQQGRLAVQVFLVVGGFLAARQLAPQGRLRPDVRPLRAVRDRYLRLVLPYAVMLLIAMGCAAVARTWLDHPSVPEPAQAGQLLVHLLLAQDLLGVEALSAGVWYVAIDFQLFVLLLALLWGAARLEQRFSLRRPAAVGGVMLLMLASLLYFSRIPAWDVAAPYFFGAYGLGVLAAWWLDRPPGARKTALAVGVAAALLLALALEFRSRIAVAAAVALAIVVLAPLRFGRWRGAVQALGGISYALFLMHFGVCLVVNAVFTRFLPATPAVQGLGLLLAWAGSLGAAWLFHRSVEAPALRWLAARSGINTPRPQALQPIR